MINIFITIFLIFIGCRLAYSTGFTDGRLVEKAKRRKLNGDKNE